MARKSRYVGYVNAMNRKEQAARPAPSIKERLSQMKQKANRKKED